MNGNEYTMQHNPGQIMNQYHTHQSQPHLVFDEETGYSSRSQQPASQSGDPNRIIREIIV